MFRPNSFQQIQLQQKQRQPLSERLLNFRNPVFLYFRFYSFNSDLSVVYVFQSHGEKRGSDSHHEDVESASDAVKPQCFCFVGQARGGALVVTWPPFVPPSFDESCFLHFHNTGKNGQHLFLYHCRVFFSSVTKMTFKTHNTFS